MAEGEPPGKKPRLNTKQCILCFKSLGKGGIVVKNPTRDGLQTIFQVCKRRKDNVYEQLSLIEDEILSNEIPVSFHKLCRANYTSSSNNYMFDFEAAEDPSADIPSVQRSIRTDFNIRSDCFICGKGNKKLERLTSITTGTGKSTREKVLETAAKRHDDVVRCRMLTHSDLFAFDAKYHRSCYGHYISDRNIKAFCSKSASANGEEVTTCYDKAFQSVKSILEETVLSNKTVVTNLAVLKAHYIEALCEMGVTDAQNYSSWKLKTKLKNYYGDRIIFFQQRGQSDLICSENMSIGDAFRQASNMNTGEDIEFSDLPSIQGQPDEYNVLHMAATILRSHLTSIKDSESYISSMDMDLINCRKYVPDPLYDFLSWCVDKTAFESISKGGSESDVQPMNLKVIAICQNLIAQSRQVRTPINIGLGLYVHHAFGSKKMVDHLHSLGYSVSYDEIRRFLTSVVLDQKDKTVYVPRGIDSGDHNVMIDAAIDNFDQNEQTLDGKFTTHAMAAVLYKRCPIDPSTCHVARAKDKSLSAADALMNDDNIRR